jgi:NADH-quinone oxidoreductase subunit G
MGIGSRVYFGRSRSGTLESPFTGNLTDICPTGVYTDKPSRYVGRRWDYERHPSLCIHCALGCNLTASARYRRVVRHEARPNPDVNGHFICDRGRYAYPYASAADRPRQASTSGQPETVTASLAAAREAIQGIVDGHGAGSVAVAASVRCSLETLAAVQQSCRHHGWTGPVAELTHRQAANLKTAVRCLQPALAVSLADLSTAHDVLVVGADPLNEAPMLALALRQVTRRGGRVSVIDPRGIDLPFEFDHWAVHPERMTAVLRALLGQMDSRQADHSPLDAPEDLPVMPMAKRLNGSARPVVVCGTDITTPDVIDLAGRLAGALCRTHVTGGLVYILPGANAFAMGLMDSACRSADRLVADIEQGRIRGLVAVDTDLWTAYPDRKRLRAALDRLAYLVVLDHVDTPLKDAADTFIPTRTLYECGGHWINHEGRLQAAEPCIAGGEPIDITGQGDHPPRVFDSGIPGSHPVPAWQAILKLAGTADAGLDRVLDKALKGLHASVPMPLGGSVGRRIVPDKTEGRPPVDRPPDERGAGDITLLLVDWTFGTETLSALSPTLAEITPAPSARMHPETRDRLGLDENQRLSVSTSGGQFTLAQIIDRRVAPGVVVIPRHHRLHWQIVADTRVVLKASQLSGQPDAR